MLPSSFPHNLTGHICFTRYPRFHQSSRLHLTPLLFSFEILKVKKERRCVDVCSFWVQVVGEEDKKIEEGGKERRGVWTFIEEGYVERRRGALPFTAYLMPIGFRAKMDERGIHEWTGWMNA